MTPYKIPTPEVTTGETWEQRERERGRLLLNSFISWVNADEEDWAIVSRTHGCAMRDEIERLRLIEKNYCGNAVQP
jgi:hypothetical protein